MPRPDDPNFLRIGPPAHPGETEITPAMVDSVRKIIRDAGGVLTVWAVLHEDLYESKYGDGIFLYVRGIALNSTDAERLAALAEKSEFSGWYVNPHSPDESTNGSGFAAVLSWHRPHSSLNSKTPISRLGLPEDNLLRLHI
jgi:hypothetical protein